MNNWKRYLIGTTGAGLTALVLTAATVTPVFAQLDQPTPQAILTAIGASRDAILARSAGFRRA